MAKGPKRFLGLVFESEVLIIILKRNLGVRKKLKFSYKKSRSGLLRLLYFNSNFLNYCTTSTLLALLPTKA